MSGGMPGGMPNVGMYVPRFGSLWRPPVQIRSLLTVKGELPRQFTHLLPNLAAESDVLNIVEHIGHPFSDLPHFRFSHATGR